MHATLKAQIRKALYGIMLLGIFLSAFGAGSLSPVRAQEAYPPVLGPTLSIDGLTAYNAVPLLVIMVDPNPAMQGIKIPATEVDKALTDPVATSATFSFTYVAAGGTDPWGQVCTTFPENAKTAFNAAAAIWTSTLQSSVPITIQACWASLSSPTTLGYSGGQPLHRDFSGVPKANTWYQGSLANSLYGSDLDPATFDMNITYNSNFTWYYGTDSNPPAGQYDLVTVAAHEIAHGLNFSGSANYSGGTGSYGIAGYPTIYDTFMEDNGGTKLTSYTNSSAALGTLLTSGSLWFNGSNAKVANGGSRVKMYAPGTWSGGSSYSHLDYDTFKGTNNSMMVYAVGSGSANHNPGPITTGLLKDLGWALAGSTDTTPPSGSWISPSNGQTISARSVTLNVNASDNSGGSGVKEVRFSAKWDGTWRGVGTASSSPYSMSWDMCSSGVPDGDIELGFEVWDNANNKWVYSEHFGNIHINKSYTCTQGTDTTPPTGSWTSPSNGQTISSQSVTLSVNASDNSGGSGVREVRWSAKWNNQWSGIGTDNSAPYSINWDMCASGVPNGDVELGMEVWDNANNVWIYSQHYTNYHINKNYTCNSSPGGWETWGWQNKYLAGYDNWHGTVTWSNDYPYIWWDFGSGGPFGWGGDEFSLRMQKDVYFPGGDYSFHTEHDDGVRVYIDGNLIIDAWWDGNGGHDAGRNLSQGNHQVKVEFYENQGDAKLHVFWYGPGYPQPDNNPPDGRITSPANHSATSSSPITITADAWDDVSGVDRVEFYVWACDSACNWRLIGTDYSAPYSADWDWSALTDQHVYLTTHIIDKTGKVRDDPGGYVEVDLDRTKPSASITSPVEGDTITGIVPILVSASDSLSGVWGVQFIVGYSDTAGSSMQGIPEPPAPAKIDKNGVVTPSDVTAQDYWKEIGWDYDGSDGWSFNWDTSGVPEQSGAAVFVYVYDKAWNYEGAVRWDISLFGPPVNDDFNSPIQINSNPYANQQNTYNATSASDDPALTDCNRTPGNRTVWYQFTPPSDGRLSIDTIGSDYDTMLAVWTGARGSLNSIGCNDDRSSDLQSELNINVSSGNVYYIEVAQYAGYLATSLSAQSGDEPKAAGEVNALSGGSLQLHMSFGRVDIISGNAGVAGAVLSYTDGGPMTTTSDASGNYSFTVPYNWSGTVTPSKTGYTFTPVNRTYTNVVANQTAQNYTATLITYTLAVSKAGAGSGTVTSSPSGINCGVDCSETYNYNTSVTLNATASTGSTFTGWSGGGCSGAGTCTVTMTAATTVTASFSDTTPPSVSWIAPVGDEQVYDVYNQSIQLEVNANDNVGISRVVFSRWDYVNLNYIEIGTVYNPPYRLNFDTSALLPEWNYITANAYDADNNSSYKYIWLNHKLPTLTVNKAGTGSGTVTSNPAGINCGSDCSEPYTYNTVVTLTATASTGSTFTGWSGGASGTSNPVSVTMTANKSFTANFTPVATIFLPLIMR